MELKGFERGLNLDSSLFESIDSEISTGEYKERISILLQEILKHRFNDNYIKQQIKPHKDRITISCPYCGDSMHNSYKKRGNIIIEGKHKGYYKCFNCGIFKQVGDFFKDYNVNLELDIINYISNNLGNFVHSDRSGCDVSMLLDNELVEKYAFEREEFKKQFNLIEAKDSKLWLWLTKRLQYNSEYFLYSPANNYVLILNLTRSGKIIGCQKRLFKGENKYITFNASKIYEMLGKGTVPDEVNTLSQVFNIFNVNINLPVTVFEGPFDSFLFRNSVGNTGANKAFPIPIPVRFWYDYDKTGLQNSLKKISEGHPVFLWEKFSKDIQLPYRKKWDLNDVIIWSKQNNINLPIFDSYFSNDPLEAIDL